MKVRPSLIQNFLDPIASALERSDGALVQRCALWHPADQFPEGLADPPLAGLDRLRSRKLCNGGVTAVIGDGGKIAEIIRQAAGIVPVGHTGEHALDGPRPTRNGENGWEGKELPSGHREQRPLRTGFLRSKVIHERGLSPYGMRIALRRAGSCEKIQNRPRLGWRGSRRASWGKDLLGRRLARRLALPIFSHLPGVRGDFQQNSGPLA